MCEYVFVCTMFWVERVDYTSLDRKLVIDTISEIIDRIQIPYLRLVTIETVYYLLLKFVASANPY